jgi:hypothetical protein
VELRLAPLSFRKGSHPSVGFESVELGDARRIVVHEVCARTCPDFENRAMRQSDKAPTDFPDRLRIAHPAYEIWIDMISVRGHGPSARRLPHGTLLGLTALHPPCESLVGVRHRARPWKIRRLQLTDLQSCRRDQFSRWH